MKKISVVGGVINLPQIKFNEEDHQDYAVFSLTVRDAMFKVAKHEEIEIYCRGRLMNMAQTRINKGNTIIIDGHPVVVMGADAKPMLRIYAHTIELLSPYERISNKYRE